MKMRKRLNGRKSRIAQSQRRAMFSPKIHSIKNSPFCLLHLCLLSLQATRTQKLLNCLCLLLTMNINTFPMKPILTNITCNHKPIRWLIANTIQFLSLPLIILIPIIIIIINIIFSFLFLFMFLPLSLLLAFFTLFFF